MSGKRDDRLLSRRAGLEQRFGHVVDALPVDEASQLLRSAGGEFYVRRYFDKDCVVARDLLLEAMCEREKRGELAIESVPVVVENEGEAPLLGTAF